jgi:hypothetical protein
MVNELLFILLLVTTNNTELWSHHNFRSPRSNKNIAIIVQYDTMLFNKAITILAVASIKRGTAAATNEEQRLRGMNTIVNTNDGEVNKYVATNPDGILPLNEVRVT